MWTEDLQGWLWETLQEKNLVRRRWKLVLRLIQRMFEDGVVPEKVTWGKWFSYQKRGRSIRG